MRDAVICEPIRTPVGGYGGALKDVTAATLAATMHREMERRESRYGLETMCIGGGQGLAAIFERVT